MAKVAATTTTVSTKGQVIVPKAIGQSRRWGPRARLVVEETADGGRPVEIRALSRPDETRRRRKNAEIRRPPWKTWTRP
jgi:bifunctional DNA-binding transcriptional regulator/antitoxin component of YhaV-PrlF toxin-antitoxin module